MVTSLRPGHPLDPPTPLLNTLPVPLTTLTPTNNGKHNMPSQNLTPCAEAHPNLHTSTPHMLPLRVLRQPTHIILRYRNRQAATIHGRYKQRTLQATCPTRRHLLCPHLTMHLRSTLLILGNITITSPLRHPLRLLVRHRTATCARRAIRPFRGHLVYGSTAIRTLAKSLSNANMRVVERRSV